MDHVTKAARAKEHLLAVWETLCQEHQRSLARLVEGVLAEITDEALDLSARLERAAMVWQSLFKLPRSGLADYGIWRDDEEERLRINSKFERHIAALDSLLS